MQESTETLKAQLKAIEEFERRLNSQHNVSPQELEGHRVMLERRDEIIAELNKRAAMKLAES
jgi:hypothetical protein